MLDLSTLYQVSNVKSRSICGENPTGEPGRGGMDIPPEGHPAYQLGQGWKTSPSLVVQPHSRRDFAVIEGPGVINHIWLTPDVRLRSVILRIYWDGQENPSVECPIGDFFCQGWEEYHPINSLAVCVNPNKGFNCYWQMPFKKHCRIEMENLGDTRAIIYFQIDYQLCELPDEIAYFHAQFRRVNPQPYKQFYTILDGVQGKGQYVGTYLAQGVNNNLWWGEGELKFFIDDDEEFPTICGTGAEDYFCGAYGFVDPKFPNQYAEFSTPYTGFQVYKPDGFLRSQMRFGMYRWHITDPIHFDSRLRVTMQDLGWRNGDKRFLPLQDDLATVAFWYQTLPTAPFPVLPDADYLEVI